jgi:hypothetical protein
MAKHSILNQLMSDLSIPALHAFLGPIGGPEIIMIFIMLIILSLPVIVILAIVWILKSRNSSKPPKND